MKQAFISLVAERIEHGPLRFTAGVLQQETRLFMGRDCVCVLLVTFPPGSPEWERAAAARPLSQAVQEVW